MVTLLISSYHSISMMTEFDGQWNIFGSAIVSLVEIKTAFLSILGSNSHFLSFFSRRDFFYKLCKFGPNWHSKPLVSHLRSLAGNIITLNFSGSEVLFTLSENLKISSLKSDWSTATNETTTTSFFIIRIGPLDVRRTIKKRKQQNTRIMH